MVPDLSLDNSLQLVTSELEKLRQTIEAISKINEKSIPDIITLYYQIVMVHTLAKKLKKDFMNIITKRQISQKYQINYQKK